MESLEFHAARMREKHGKRKHGTIWMYGRGCRCAPCRTKNAFVCRSYYTLRKTLAYLRSVSTIKESE